jgi:hypothetical protein
MSNRRPRATAPAVWLAGALALGLAALGAAGVRDLAVDQGWANGSSWAGALVEALDGLESSVALAVAGGVVALVGLLVLVLGLRPGRATHVALGTGTDAGADAWITPRAVGALARAVADRSSGVLEARTVSVSPRRVRVRVTAAEDPASVAGAAQADVDAALRTVNRPTVVVSARTRKE